MTDAEMREALDGVAGVPRLCPHTGPTIELCIECLAPLLREAVEAALLAYDATQYVGGGDAFADGHAAFVQSLDRSRP